MKSKVCNADLPGVFSFPGGIGGTTVGKTIILLLNMGNTSSIISCVLKIICLNSPLVRWDDLHVGRWVGRAWKIRLYRGVPYQYETRNADITRGPTSWIWLSAPWKTEMAIITFIPSKRALLPSLSLAVTPWSQSSLFHCMKGKKILYTRPRAIPLMK